MKYLLLSGVLLLAACNPSKNIVKQHIPDTYKGRFTDDYSIRYTISDTLFLQEPNVKYHILKWNLKDRYIIAKNDAHNPSEENLYTRIDYMEFENMQPYLWGFCFTAYNAENATAAEKAAAADRENPKKGCGGFPFSRLKRAY